MKIALTKKLADTMDMIVLVNSATRFIVAIYQVKRKDLKNVAEMMRTAILNTLLSVNLHPELVGEYFCLAGEEEHDKESPYLLEASGQTPPEDVGKPLNRNCFYSSYGLQYRQLLIENGG